MIWHYLFLGSPITDKYSDGASNLKSRTSAKSSSNYICIYADNYSSVWKTTELFYMNVQLTEFVFIKIMQIKLDGEFVHNLMREQK